MGKYQEYGKGKALRFFVILITGLQGLHADFTPADYGQLSMPNGYFNRWESPTNSSSPYSQKPLPQQTKAQAIAPQDHASADYGQQLILYDDWKKFPTRQKKKFAANVMGLKSLPADTRIRKGKKLGEGSYGAVYEGLTQNGQKIVIKEALDGNDDATRQEGRENMQIEADKSRKLVNGVFQELRQENPNYGILAGANVIVPVLAQTPNGGIVEEKVEGQTLQQTLDDGIAPYNNSDEHYPNDLKEAIIRAAGFYNGVATLHHANLIHGDLKNDNVLVANDPLGCYPCKIIDLGLSCEIGTPITATSGNAPFEYSRITSQQYKITREIEALQRKLELIDEKLEALAANNPIAKIVMDIKNQSQSPIDYIKQLRALEWEKPYEQPEILKARYQLEARREFLELEIDSLDEMLESITPIAYPYYDIYTSAMVLLPLLFGQEGQIYAHLLYWRDDDDNSSPYIKEATQDPNFNAHDYFLGLFTQLNENMGQKTNLRYPDPVLQKLAALQAAISSLNPEERPNAIEIIETLQNLGLSDWEHGHYEII
jgi:serine/threonine protein kinase